MKSARLERYVKADVRKCLARMRIVNFCYIPGEPGIMDRIGIIPVIITKSMMGRKLGLFLGVECKKKGEWLTRLQREKRRQLKAAGALVVRVSSDKQLKRLEVKLKQIVKSWGK